MGKPILFSTPMVRALLAGTKTQTRRLNGVPVIEQMPNGLWHIRNRHGCEIVTTPAFDEKEIGETAAQYLPIQRGDRLYVRELWRTEASFDGFAPSELKATIPIHYEADRQRVRWRDDLQAIDFPGRLRIGMHMPRWASRITLTVTDVRVERLQSISDEDAIAEGIEVADPAAPAFGWKCYLPETKAQDAWTDARESYRTLWTSINGPGSWEANPWIAAYAFEVALGNIDELARAA